MDWLGTIKTIAPTVASALCGPLAGAAVAALGDIFGVSEPTKDSIQKIITNGQMTAEQVARVRELELQYQNEEKERGFRYAELEFKDRDSARDRDARLAEAGKKNVRADLMFFLAVFVICGLVWIVWKDPSINEYVKGIFTLVLGRFLGYLDNIYSFEFGTTRSSQQKNELLAQAQPPIK